MREKWNRQMPLMPEIASHTQAKELEMISGIIDGKPIICQFVLQDLCKGRPTTSRAGARGMSAEQDLRAALSRRQPEHPALLSDRHRRQGVQKVGAQQKYQGIVGSNLGGDQPRNPRVCR